LVSLLLFDFDCIINLTVSLNFLVADRFFNRRDRCAKIWVLCNIQCFVHSIVTEIFVITVTLIGILVQINCSEDHLRAFWLVFKLYFYCFCLWRILFCRLSLKLLVGVHHGNLFIFSGLLWHSGLKLVLLVTLLFNLFLWNFHGAVWGSRSIVQRDSKHLVLLSVNCHILVKRNSSCILVHKGLSCLCEVVWNFRNCSLHNFLHYLVLLHGLKKLRYLHSQILDWGRLIDTYSDLVAFVYWWTFWTFYWWGSDRILKHFWLAGLGRWRGCVTLCLWLGHSDISTVARFCWFQIARHFLLRLFYHCLHQHNFACSLFSVVITI
jgi:hypothetical protein